VDQSTLRGGGAENEQGGKGWGGKGHTLFPDQTIVAVVGVVGITQPSVAVFEFEEFVAVFT